MELILAICVTGLGLFGSMFFIWQGHHKQFSNEDRPFKKQWRGPDGKAVSIGSTHKTTSCWL
jgi:hypothetical protein